MSNLKDVIASAASRPRNDARSRKSRMRVGYVVKRYPRYSETFIVNEILANEAAGLDIEIFSLYPPLDTHFHDTISRVKAPVHYLQFLGLPVMDFWAAIQRQNSVQPDMLNSITKVKGENDMFRALQLAKEVRARNICLLHAHFATQPAAVARLAARFAGIPYTFTSHAKDIFHESVNFNELRYKFQDAAAAVTISDYNFDYLRKRFGAGARKLVRIYNGLDLKQFSYALSARKKGLILAIGRLVEKKGFSDLIEACSFIAKEGIDFQCEIIGTGPLEGALRQKINALKLAGKVKLLGPRPQYEVIKLLSQAAVLAAPCVIARDKDQDGLPMVILEAMSLGTPCVATDISGIPEAIQHNRSGLLAPAHNPRRLGIALKKMLNNEPFRLHCAENARRLIEQRFDVGKNSEELREVFSRAIEKR